MPKPVYPWQPNNWPKLRRHETRIRPITNAMHSWHTKAPYRCSKLDNTRRDLTVYEAAVRAARDRISQAKAKVAAAKEAVMEATAHVTAVKSEVHQARASAVQIETARKQYEADLATVQQ